MSQIHKLGFLKAVPSEPSDAPPPPRPPHLTAVTEVPLAPAAQILLAQGVTKLPTPGGKLDEARAQILFKHGEQLMNAGRPGDAAHKFISAYQAYPLATMAVNAGAALFRAGLYSDALVWLNKGAEEAMAAAGPAGKDEARAALAEHLKGLLPAFENSENVARMNAVQCHCAGVVALLSGSYGLAAKLFKATVEKDPDATAAWLNVARAYQRGPQSLASQQHELAAIKEFTATAGKLDKEDVADLVERLRDFSARVGSTGEDAAKLQFQAGEVLFNAGAYAAAADVWMKSVDAAPEQMKDDLRQNVILARYKQKKAEDEPARK